MGKIKSMNTIVEIRDGSGEKWITVHGTHIKIGENGQVEAGPDVFHVSPDAYKNITRHQAQNLPSEHRKALEEYQRQHYRYVNAILKGKENQLGKPQQQIGRTLLPKMNAAFEHEAAKIPENLIVHRGMSLHEIGYGHNPEELVGKTVKNPGFLSTTVNRNVAMQFAKNSPMKTGKAVVTLRAPAGSKAVSMNALSSQRGATSHKEEEVLFHPGSEIKYTKHEKRGDIHYLEGELVSS